jgi:hypothetical protein
MKHPKPHRWHVTLRNGSKTAWVFAGLLIVARGAGVVDVSPEVVDAVFAFALGTHANKVQTNG